MAELPHVMISYQWDAQKRMLKLRDELTKAGYDVWMDVDQMGKLYDFISTKNVQIFKK